MLLRAVMLSAATRSRLFDQNGQK